VKKQIKMAFDYFKANAYRISGSAKVLDHDFHLHVVELQNTGPLTHLSLASLAFPSGLRGRSAQNQLLVLGDMSLGGNISPVESIAECLQVAFDAGANPCGHSDEQREGYSNHSGGVVYQVSDELLCGSGWKRCSRRWRRIDGHRLNPVTYQHTLAPILPLPQIPPIAHHSPRSCRDRAAPQ